MDDGCKDDLHSRAALCARAGPPDGRREGKIRENKKNTKNTRFKEPGVFMQQYGNYRARSTLPLRRQRVQTFI